MPIELKMNMSIKKVKTINIWEENMRFFLSALAVNDIIHKMNFKKSTNIKEKIDKFNYIKNKNFCSSKTP